MSVGSQRQIINTQQSKNQTQMGSQWCKVIHKKNVNVIYKLANGYKDSESIRYKYHPTSREIQEFNGYCTVTSVK